MADASPAPTPGAPAPSLAAPVASPDAEIVTPPPWALTGEGLILLLAAKTRAAAAPGLAGRWSAVSFVDYRSSPVGPYRELLHIPRVVRWPGTIGATVRDIWVDSVASAVSGNANWGLTKSVIAFDRTDVGGGAERWTATDGATTLAQVTTRPFGPPIPVGKPRGAGQLVQHRDGHLYETPVSATALVRFSRVIDAEFDADLVVDLERHRVIAAVAVSHLRLGFHEARITPTQ